MKVDDSVETTEETAGGFGAAGGEHSAKVGAGVGAAAAGAPNYPKKKKALKKKKKSKIKIRMKAQCMNKNELKQYQKRVTAAVNAHLRGEYPSLTVCAKELQIPRSTLFDQLQAEPGYKLQKPGKRSTVFKEEEERTIVSTIQWNATTNKAGLSFTGLKNLMQTTLKSIHKADPQRKNLYEERNFVPYNSFVQRFMKRHNLTTVMSTEISKGRSALQAKDLMQWFAITEEKLNNDKDLKEVFSDPDRIWNCDETGAQLGTEKRRVVAKFGTRNVKHLNSGSGSRQSVSVAYTVSASGKLVPPRAIYAGVRNLAERKLSTMPADGKSGQWSFSRSDKGFQTSETFLECLQDLDKFLEEQKIKRPIIVYMDQATCHVSLAIISTGQYHST